MFNNKFAAVMLTLPDTPTSDNPLFKVLGVQGLNQLIGLLMSYRNTLLELTPNEVQDVVETWHKPIGDLGREYLWFKPSKTKVERFTAAPLWLSMDN